MKLLLPFLLLPFIALSQQKPKPAPKKASPSIIVTGKLKGLVENEWVSLSDVNVPEDTIAKVRVKNGSFKLKGVVAEPNLVNLNFHNAQKKLMLFAGNDSVYLAGDVGQLQFIKVGGSATHNDFMAFQQLFNPLFEKLSALNVQIASNPELNRNDSIMQAYQGVFNKIQTAIDSFATIKKASPLGAFTILVTSELSQDIALLENRFNRLDPVQQQGFYGKILKNQIDEGKIGAVGSEAIAFTQVDTAGTPVSLSSFKGKYVLIDFWASWCKPCRMENPNVVAAYNRFKGKNFTVLGISLDRSKEDWLKAIKDDGLYWTQLSDLKFWNNEVAQQYHIQSIPQNFLIGPDGKIVAKNLRGSELMMKLCDLLGCE